MGVRVGLVGYGVDYMRVAPLFGLPIDDWRSLIGRVKNICKTPWGGELSGC
jgi:hypothetical protein